MSILLFGKLAVDAVSVIEVHSLVTSHSLLIHVVQSLDMYTSLIGQDLQPLCDYILQLGKLAVDAILVIG